MILKKTQIDKFAKHIQAANQVNKPVVVHIRAAKQDTLDILKSENVEKCGGILHCFTEDYDMAKKDSRYGYVYIIFWNFDF